MENVTLLTYDGSFDGFLSAVFYCYEHKCLTANLQPAHLGQASLFGSAVSIMTQPQQAKRVWEGITKKQSPLEAHTLYRAFLSERKGIENLLFRRIRDILEHGNRNQGNYGDATVLEISKVAKMVSREKHRMEAFVRFKLTKDGIYFAVIEPDFNVLPLIAKHFKNRYADQQWLIYDTYRNTGLFYDKQVLSEVFLESSQAARTSYGDGRLFAQEEIEFQELWATYFDSTNIESRRNMKLHKRHIPQRYWKYLSEKSLQLKK